MFITINGVNYNIYSIASFTRKTEAIDNGSEEPTLVYFIIYELSNGSGVVEQFNDIEARNAKYQMLVERFGIEDEGKED